MIPVIDKWMDYRETGNDLERGIDRPAYILTGEELFLVRQIRDRIVAALVSPGSESMDLVKLSGDGKPSSIDAEGLLAEIGTPPFLSAHKVIQIDQSGFFSSQASSGVSGELARVLGHLPENCHLVFTEESVHSSNPLLRQMRKQGTLSARFGQQKAPDLQAWISALCGREKLRITREAADSLIRRCDYSMSAIFSDLSIIFLYFHFTEKRDVTLADIEYLGREDLTGKIFDLTDAIAAGRVDEALGRLDVLLARREAPLFIQTMLARQTRDLLIAAECESSDRILESGVTQSQFFARKLARQAKSFTMQGLEAMMENCFQADLAVKTGRLGSEEALSILVIRACGAA
ncbi:MAG TPA: DNA polymerase III subunit delta [Bacillota bacterium]|jgi:DNA polymerase-3 subunit delta|nr:DNA polymerase III subunit delta [Fastidiosipila sp.]HPX93764.1 DNA polymerase III subunit delta [Bacillota bacterium]HQB81564.1 DNA polymerase III subunit delta [Bacillota bacterium]